MDVSTAYATQATATASPAQLVLMLYDAALARIVMAEQALAADQAEPEAVHEALTRAQAIVHELNLALDHERGGSIAANLADLYSFCTAQLVDANIRKDPAPLAGVTGVLRGLREAWEHACVAGAVPVEVAG